MPSSPKKQACSLKRQGCNIDATLMQHWWNIDESMRTIKVINVDNVLTSDTSIFIDVSLMIRWCFMDESLMFTRLNTYDFQVGKTLKIWKKHWFNIKESSIFRCRIDAKLTLVMTKIINHRCWQCALDWGISASTFQFSIHDRAWKWSMMEFDGWIFSQKKIVWEKKSQQWIFLELVWNLFWICQKNLIWRQISAQVWHTTSPLHDVINNFKFKNCWNSLTFEITECFKIVLI